LQRAAASHSENTGVEFRHVNFSNASWETLGQKSALGISADAKGGRTVATRCAFHGGMSMTGACHGPICDDIADMRSGFEIAVEEQVLSVPREEREQGHYRGNPNHPECHN
jgi:hypothetical protein